MNMHVKTRYIDPHNAALIWGISRRMVYKLIEAKKVPCVQFSKRTFRIPKDFVEEIHTTMLNTMGTKTLTQILEEYQQNADR